MCALVRMDLHAHAETFQAEVEVRAHRALDSDRVADVLGAIIAVEQSPAYGTYLEMSKGFFFNLSGGCQKCSCE